MADYADVLARYETWVVDGPDGLQGALILEPRPNDLLIWSVAVAPDAQRSGLGGRLLAQAEARAGDLGKRTMRLYTGEKLAGNIAWYQRHGYVIERVEAMADRNAVHMVKHLA
jgi:ribosomal protein S18 acetylase RimI-like enzyme